MWCVFRVSNLKAKGISVALYILSWFIGVVKSYSRLKRISQGIQLEETPAMKKKSTEREISIKVVGGSDISWEL